MKGLFERCGDFGRKRPVTAIGIVIIIFYLVVAIPLIVLLATNVPPSGFKTATGTVAEYKHHVKDNPNIIDYWTNDSSSYLDVKFTDGTYYRLIGTSYNHTDDGLFERISVGTQMTVIYKDGGFGGTNFIYGVDYMSANYLNPDDVVAEIAEGITAKNIGYSVALGAATVVAIVAFIIVYKKLKKKEI
ncbi:MAG: hypothetical protein K2N47_05735 [Clostridia bacterium]|nr:hypothetical protein [Clostridia bacterium]